MSKMLKLSTVFLATSFLAVAPLKAHTTLSLEPDLPLYTDGCTIVDPILRLFNIGKKWRKYACLVHDKAYWRGGTHREKIIADLLFIKNSWQKGGIVGKLMALPSGVVVLIGGQPIIPYGVAWKCPRKPQGVCRLGVPGANWGNGYSKPLQWGLRAGMQREQRIKQTKTKMPWEWRSRIRGK